jgi:hypothetical protein
MLELPSGVRALWDALDRAADWNGKDGRPRLAIKMKELFLKSPSDSSKIYNILQGAQESWREHFWKNPTH